MFCNILGKCFGTFIVLTLRIFRQKIFSLRIVALQGHFSDCFQVAESVFPNMVSTYQESFSQLCVSEKSSRVSEKKSNFTITEMLDLREKWFFSCNKLKLRLVNWYHFLTIFHLFHRLINCTDFSVKLSSGRSMQSLSDFSKIYASFASFSAGICKYYNNRVRVSVK